MDRREEFNNIQWQQGRLLDTPDTTRWPETERSRVDEIERKQAFVYFTTEDQGRGRVRIFVFDTAQLCADAVYAHNAELKSRSLLRKY